MKINLILFSSPLHDQVSILKARESLIEGLRAFSDLNILPEKDYAHWAVGKHQSCKEALTIAFIASGGTEEKFLNLMPFLEQPLIILSDGYHNSLAASFEICTWLENNNYEHTLLHIPEGADNRNIKDLREKLVRIHNHILLKRRLKGKKIGLLGGASGWLIASQIDKQAVSRELGFEFRELPIEMLTDKFSGLKKSGRNFGLDPLTERLSGFLAPERSREDLAEAVALYYAMKEICTENGLDAVTVKCFDLLAPCRTTACLALALLNDEGMVAGCEGDIPTLCTMLILKSLSGHSGFMANPASANRKELTVDFAHCTLPLSFGTEFRLPSHFESSIGIGIQAHIPEGTYTILKIGGKNLDKRYMCTGRVISCPQIPQRCRTQVRFRFNNCEDFDFFMANRLGNHIVLAKGVVNI